MADAGAGPARLDLIGAFRLVAPGGEPIVVSSRRGRALIAFLTLAPDRSATRERLCGLLWSDRPEPQARASLRQLLLELRDGLAAGAPGLIEAGRERVRLAPGSLVSDIEAITAALAAGDTAAAAAALTAVGGALMLEDLDLPGLFQDWLARSRARVDQSLAEAVHASLTRLVRDGEGRTARALADAWLQRDPVDEEVVALAIRSETALGGASAAQRRFQALSARLEREFAAAPGPAVREAMAAVTTAAAPRPEPTPPAPAERQASGPPLLAVLPFDDLSDAAELAPFPIGLAEEILQAVTRDAAVRVIGRSASFRFTGPDKAARRVAAELGATLVLDGSVRRSGGELRIAAHLIDGESETILWSAGFQGELGDLFAVQDTVASAVAEALRRLAGPAAPAPGLPAGVWALYQRARGLALGAREPEIRLFERVLARAPGFAPAWAGLAVARGWRGRFEGGEPFSDAERARTAREAKTALQLDPKAGQAFIALSHIEPYASYAVREALLRQALAVSPEDEIPLCALSSFCSTVGRHQEALDLAVEAEALAPAQPLPAQRRAACLFAMGRWQEALEAWREGRRRWPGVMMFTINPLLAAAFHGQWPAFEALAADTGVAASRSPRVLGVLALAGMLREPTARHLAGRLADAREKAARPGRLTLTDLGLLYLLGLKDETFEILHEVSFAALADPATPSPGGWYNPAGVFLDAIGLFRDRRFPVLCDKLSLGAYWLETDRWPDCAALGDLGYDFRGEIRRLAATDTASAPAAAHSHGLVAAS